MKLSGSEQEIIDKYESGLSTVQIAEQYSVTHQSINKLLKRKNIPLRSIKDATGVRFLNSTKVSLDFLSNIDGWLLGDGSIIYTGSKQAYFQHVSKHKEYVQYVSELFEQEGIVCKIGRFFSKNSDSYYWKLYTQRTVQLKKVHDRWYNSDGKKIVPNDISISKSAMKNWIMDDGSLDKRDGILSLHTNAFDTRECWLLVDKIKDLVEQNVGKINVIVCKKVYPRITINRKATEHLLTKIGQCDVKCFSYKWGVK